MKHTNEGVLCDSLDQCGIGDWVKIDAVPSHLHKHYIFMIPKKDDITPKLLYFQEKPDIERVIVYWKFQKKEFISTGRQKFIRFMRIE